MHAFQAILFSLRPKHAAMWGLVVSLLLVAGPGRGQAPPAVADAASAAAATATVATSRADSARTQLLSTDTRQLRRFDSLRQQNTLRLTQLQDELRALATAPAGRDQARDQVREQEVRRELTSLRAADSLRRAHARRRIDSLRATTSGYPVAPHGDTLFLVYARLGPFAPRERAALTTEKILRLERQAFFEPDSLRVFTAEQSADLMYGELVIQSLSDDDALWLNTPRDTLAAQHRARIAAAVSAHRDSRSLYNLAREAGLVLLVLVSFYFVVRFVNRFFHWVQLKLTARETTWFRGVRLGTYELLTPQRTLGAVLFVVGILRWVVIFLMLYLVLPLLFSIFPGTQGVADMLLGYALTPLKRIGLALWHFLPNLITIVVIVTVFQYLLRGLAFLRDEIREGRLALEGFYPDWAAPTFQIVRVLVYAFMVIVIFPYLPGSDSPVFQGVSVFLGFLFTFGSAGSLSNIVAGLVLTYMRSFRLGDRVRIGDVTGDVMEKTLLVTRVRTITNEEITIPNSTVMGSYTTNYSAAAPTTGLILHTTVTIGYDVPWKQVHELLIAAALASEGIVPEPAPFVLQTSLEDFYVAYQLNAYTRSPNQQGTIYSRIHQNIQDHFNAGGVEILSPHYRAARDGSATTIPASYLPSDYTAPPFRVANVAGSPPPATPAPATPAQS